MKRRTINNMMTRLMTISCVCLFIFTLVSCENRELYYKFKELPGADWRIEDELLFKIDSLDIELNAKYDISVEITNNTDYAYQNLWLFSEYAKNDSVDVKAQEEFLLADAYGKWRGAGFGSLYQSSHVVMKSVVLDPNREYDLYVRHGMQDKVLHGIEKVGIKISKSIVE